MIRAFSFADDELLIGDEARALIVSCDDIEVRQLKQFYDNCRQFFVAAIQEIKKRCPLDEPVLKQISFLSPQLCLRMQLSELQSGIVNIAKRFPNVVKEEEVGLLKEEVEDFKLQPLHCDLSKLDPASFWHAVSKLVDPVSSEPLYTILPRFMKALLLLYTTWKC